jgi:hypothetical protein
MRPRSPGEATVAVPASYVTDHVALAYAVTVHKAQCVTVDHAVLLVDRATTAEHLYVGMTRGREHNLACVITEPAGDEHTHTPAPTPTQVLTAAMRKTSSEKSATETLRDQLDHLHKPLPLQPAAAIFDGLRQTQQHSYHETIRREAQRQVQAYPSARPAPTITIDGPDL